ncbi:S9 family peptidase [Nevskia sp.]|uniref:alpha/beta hydrolase family protein n=1 Tax=Nevskia sp. TaxID=1929292 RepID=UPI0025E9DA2B|nr:S9 family peptidase [Nevskia sp.]
MNYGTFFGLALTAVCALSGLAGAAEPISVEAFARPAEFENLQLSPDGTMVAAVIPGLRSGGMVMLSLPKFERVGAIRFGNETQIARFWWVGDRQLVAELGFRDGPLDHLISSADFVTFAADGSGMRYVVGQQGSLGAAGSRIVTQTLKRVFVHMVDPLVDDPEHVIVSSVSIDAGDNAEAVLSKLNLQSSRMEKLAVAPRAGPASFLLDRDKKPRYVSVGIGGFRYRTWARDTDRGEWSPLESKGQPAIAEPLVMSADNQSVFLRSAEFGPRDCLVEQVLATHERRKLACHDSADLDHVINVFSPSGPPIAAVFEAGKPEIKLLDNTGRDGELLKLLMEAFPNKEIEISSVTRDGRKALIRTSDDRTPADYYLFDTETREADYLLGLQVWLDPERMGERRPIALKARDGTPLHGYLTLPPGSDGKKLPLVVHPHGGPFFVRDHWTFDTDPQLLASRGYAVLQVNFRGSDGFGTAFIDAGKKAWGTTMIDDITDATRWAIEQGYADEKRVCIYGWSYGGYASLMSAIREPGLYRCVVGAAGVYDLKLLRDDGDVGSSGNNRRYFTDAIAGGPEEMAAGSPITYLDQLKAPVLIVHGEADRRAPFTQATALCSAMKKRNLPFEWLAKPGEGHGFIEQKNKVEFYTTLLSFLDRHIGPQAAASSSPTAAVAAD